MGVIGMEPNMHKYLMNSYNHTKEEILLMYRKAVNLWGVQAQTMMLAEESSELTKAALKHIRRPDASTEQDLADEIADTLIMIEQIVDLFELEDWIDYFRSIKLIRLNFKVNQVEIEDDQVPPIPSGGSLRRTRRLQSMPDRSKS
jgi:NTP pyrophosphatase (non-canonical NTP hydrolase)